MLRKTLRISWFCELLRLFRFEVSAGQLQADAQAVQLPAHSNGHHLSRAPAGVHREDPQGPSAHLSTQHSVPTQELVVDVTTFNV